MVALAVALIEFCYKSHTEAAKAKIPLSDAMKAKARLTVAGSAEFDTSGTRATVRKNVARDPDADGRPGWNGAFTTVSPNFYLYTHLKTRKCLNFDGFVIRANYLCCKNNYIIVVIHSTSAAGWRSLQLHLFCSTFIQSFFLIQSSLCPSFTSSQVLFEHFLHLIV